MDAQRRQLADHLAVATGGLGLALQRAQLAPHLAQEVLDPQQVGLGGVEAPLGPFLALAVLEDAGRLLDHGSPVLRAGVEHGVDLTLADDDVLLATDAGVAQELLDVEEAARDAVDGVLAVARAPQGPGQGDLGELDGQQAVGVVDREADLGSAEGGAARVPAKMTSSIFWLRTLLGAWAPSTQAMASTTLDLPLPLGPTTTVTPGSSVSTVVSAKDLKPLRVSWRRNTASAGRT